MSLNFREISFQNTRRVVDFGLTAERFVQPSKGSTEQIVPVPAPVPIDTAAGGKPLTIWHAYDGRYSGVSAQMLVPDDRKVEGDAGGGRNIPPTGSVTIYGTATEGETLTAEACALTDQNGLGMFGYQWLRDRAGIAGAVGRVMGWGSPTLGRKSVCGLTIAMVTTLLMAVLAMTNCAGMRAMTVLLAGPAPTG